MAQRRGGSAKAARRRARKRASKVQVRKKKEFTYRGFSLEEIKELTEDEIMDLLPSRQARTINRGFSDGVKKFYDRLKKNPDATIKTHRREALILPFMIGCRVAVHNGKEFKEFEIQPEMFGHYLGEFALTRTFGKHSGPGVGATRSSKFMPLK